MTVKSFTDIEQSKKLAEILPIESADMWWAERYEGHTTMDYQYVLKETPYYYLSLKKPSIDNYSQDAINDIPCWSLAALLKAMPDRIDDSHFLTLDKEGKEYCCCYEDINGNSFKHEFADNTIDACVKMIEKLHTENLI